MGLLSWVGFIGLLYLMYEMIKALRYTINVVRFTKTNQAKITKESLLKQSKHFTQKRLIVIAIVALSVVLIQLSLSEPIFVLGLFGLLTLFESYQGYKKSQQTMI